VLSCPDFYLIFETASNLTLFLCIIHVNYFKVYVVE
jgi:hypothetical protein